MNCTSTGVNLSFDKYNRLSKTLTRISATDTNKRIVLASFLLNDDFKNYLLKSINKDDVYENKEIDFDNFNENDYYKVNQNKLGALLNTYYLEHYFSVANSKTNKGSGQLNGFKTASAKTVARNYTATILVDEYAKDAKKPKNERRSTIAIVKAVNEKILNTFYDRTTAFAQEVINGKEYSKEDKKFAKQYINASNELASLYEETASDKQWYNIINSRKKEITDNIIETKNALIEAANNKDKKLAISLKQQVVDLKREYDKISEDTNITKQRYEDKRQSENMLSINKYAYAQNFINIVANSNTIQQGERLLNYANLVAQTRGDTDAWYFGVYNTKTMTSITKAFSQIGDISEFITEEDNNIDEIDSEYDGRSIDETTRTWEDSLAKNFTQNVDNDIKIILSTISKLNGKYNATSKAQSLDTNNELGVASYMSAPFVITQIFSFADCTNVDSFIKSIEQKANSVSSLYGIGKIVSMMKQDKVFANRMFANFAKPVMAKVMLTVSDITDSNGINFDWSNKSVNPTTKLIYDFSNKLRATYNTSYSNTDLTDIKSAVTAFKENKNKEVLKNALYDIISKYLPNINKNSFNDYFNNISDTNEFVKLSRDIYSIINECGKLKDKINIEINRLNNINEENYNDYLKALYTYNNATEEERVKVERPTKPERLYIDYSKFDFSNTAYSAIIGLSKKLTNFVESDAMLNSTNAEGSSASSIGKNCFITRFFERINSSTKEDINAGLRAMLDEYTKGTENGRENQYSNNPILFGIKDEYGKVIQDGMFVKTATGYNINPNAKQMLKYYLFDGSRSTTNGKAAGYAKLSKLDWFISTYIAFTHGIEEMTDDGFTNKIGNLDMAVYPTRIGSDAPKIFNIRAPKYTNSQLRYCLYNHVLDEINMMIKGLNKVFIQEGNNFVLTNNKHGLQQTAFYRKELAKNGKLTGTLFEFNRLFPVEGYNAGEKIMQILSLYGEGDQVGAINVGIDGRFNLNSTDTIFYNGSEFTINLSDEQKQQLLQVVDEWTNAYLAEANEKLGYFENVFANNGIEYNKSVINNMLLNQVNMNIVYDDIFEGDYKFYGKARTFLKRTKESQAGGDGYAGYDVNAVFDGTLKDLEYNKQKEVISIQSSNQVNENGTNKQIPITINGKTLVARNGWRGVTIYNTVKASDYADQLQKETEQIFIKQGINEETAHKMSVKLAEGYGYSATDVTGNGTIINDAQSYITFEEFIRRRYADGTIQEYADLIEELNSDKPIEEIDFDAINKRIQVQKNFYYDKIYDKDTGLYTPRQIKNAEFVLIPKLLPKDSELRKVYDWMMKNDIGQLNTEETSKAAKKTVFTIWDRQTGTFNENFEEGFDESYVETYSYQYLYKQQEVPQHMADEHNKAGIQIMKKVIDNIIDETNKSDDSKKELVRYANEFQQAYTANIKEDFDSFLDAMGWKYDSTDGKIKNASDGSINLNFTDFYDRARQEAARLGLDSNFIEYLIPNEFGRPNMPNYDGRVANKLESIAQSIYNNRITRQELPGWHGAQITGVGYSKKLKFDPVTGIMEVYLPKWSKLIPKGKNAEEEAAILKQIQEEGLDLHIGYRMPTEGKQSVSVIKVVGFTNEALGSTIVVPDEWVIQTGSDFDVDSIYGISWEMYSTTNKNKKVELHKVPYEEGKISSKDLYIKYVKKNIENKIKRDNIGNEIGDAIKELHDKFNYVNERNELSDEFSTVNDKRNKLYTKLPIWAKVIIKNANTEFKTTNNKEKRVTDIRIAYPKINERLINYLNNNKVSEKVINIVNEYMDYQTATIDIINKQDGIPTFDIDTYRSEKAEAISKIIEDANNKYFSKIEEAAKKVGLEDFNTFKERPFVEQLDRRARNNFILDRMMKIMGDENSREEQYGRSNFEKITNSDGTGANDIVDKLYKENTRNRSPYNPLDQMDYQEDVMGGARLKALSVNWDNFCSKNNRIRALLSDILGIDVVLENDIEDSQIQYNFDEIEKSYGELRNETNEKQDNKTDNKKYLIYDANEKEIYITKQRLNELKDKGLIDNANSDTKLITIPWNEFAKYNKKINDGFGNTETKEIVKDYLLNYLGYDYKDIPFIKGKVWITQGLYNLLINTSSDEFLAITCDIDKINNSTINNTKKDRKITKNIIEKYIEGLTNDDINTTKDDAVLNAIKRTFNEDNRLDSTTNTIIGKSIFNIKDFAKNYPKSYNYLKSIYDQQNNINNNSDVDTNIKVFHANKLGFSNNNRNLVGGLITTDSAQTTAHHLDAVKMGSVPNVNEYTFNTYKLLSTLGIDYETIISFIRQPAITRIVDNNNLINSIFLNSKDNPIRMSITQIAIELNLNIDAKHKVTEYSLLKDTISAIQNNYEIVSAFEELFGYNLASMPGEEIMKIKLPLNKRAYFDRIRRFTNKEGNVYENAAFDLGVILTFNNIKKTADKVNDYIRITNADKFGAPVSMRETRQMIDSINKLRGDNTFNKNGVNLVDLIYPLDKEHPGLIDVNKSAYPSIAAVYNYATINSYNTNKQLFITENEEFAAAEDFVQKAIHHKFTESEYKDYKRYAISSLYSQIPVLLSPVTLDKQGNVRIVQQTQNENNNKHLNANEYWNEERSRIYGYGIATNGDFNIKNVNEPTDKEIVQFNKLTPAQKVLFIQKHFNDNAGIFNYINVTLFNPNIAKYKGVSRQYLSYNDQVSDIEDLYYLFDNAYFNKNPLIKLATVDLIKYAYIVEGFNFKTGYISKIIPNNCLYTNAEEGGMDIIRFMDTLIHQLPGQIMTEDFIMNFVRSHSEYIGIKRMPNLPETVIDQYTGIESYKYHNITIILKGLTRADGLIHIDTTVNNKILEDLINKLDLSNNKNGYIRINNPINKNKRNTTLYKIECDNPIYNDAGEVVQYQDYYLIPLNILDAGENFDYSYNENNNKHNSIEYYYNEINDINSIINNIRSDKVDARTLRQEINRQIPTKLNPVGKYNNAEDNIHNNPTKLLELYNSGDKILAAGVQKLVNGIINHIERTENGLNTPYVVFNPNISLRQLLNRGEIANQEIELSDGSKVKVTIEHHAITKRLVDGINKMLNGQINAAEYKDAINEMNQSKTHPTNVDLYRITRAKEDKKVLDNNTLNATTDLIVDDNEIDNSLGITPRRGTRIGIDGVSRQIINEINYNARKNKVTTAERFIQELNRRRVNPYMEASRKQNRRNIYQAAARYYQTAANSLINALDKFTIAGEVYSFDEAEMYEALAKHDEYFGDVAKIILDSITFGNRISDIVNLDLAAEDLETKQAVESIINSINSIKNNRKASIALDNIINIYFKKYSTNPLIREDIMKLRETFGDMDAIDFWIADPFDIDNNEVQTILKQVYSTFAKVEMFDTRKNVQEWKDKLAEIDAMSDTLDINKVIDSKCGIIRQEFNDDFIKEKERLLDELNDARMHKNDSVEAFKRYVNAKYAKDKFYQEHIEQQIVDDYYKQDIELREKAMDIPNDYYYIYLRLTNELYNINNESSESSEEQTKRKKQIIAAISEMRNNDTDEAQALNDYITKKRELQEKYFSSQEYEGFKEIYERYDRYIKKYDAKNITKTLEEKLQDIGYKEAYDWINESGSLRYTGKEAAKLRNAFKALTGYTESIPKKILNRIKTISGAVDEKGIINPMALTDEQIQQLHDAEEEVFTDTYGDPLGDGMLIKQIPSNLPLTSLGLARTEKQRQVVDYTYYQDNKRKNAIITEINKTLFKIIDKDSSKIVFDDLFNNDIVSEEERLALIRNYNELRELSKNPFKKFKKNANEVYTDEINEEAYLETKNYYNTNLKNTRQGIQWINLFTELDEKGNIQPNRLIFGYRLYADKFIDKEKTEGRDYINNNVDFVNTEYYDIAKREATAKGEEYYDKWFKRNHVYNPYSHKWSPLKIWTIVQAKPGSALANSIQYVPTFDNLERNVRPEYVNSKYNEFGNNYKKGDSRYDSDITLTDKEKKYKDLLVRTLNKYVTTYQGKRFVGQGYLPRERKTEIDTRWAATNTLGMFGLSYRSNTSSDDFNDDVDYAHDREAEMKMLQLIKDKGTKKLNKLPIRQSFNTEEEYQKELAKVKEENKLIKQQNETIDNANLNTNWNDVMEHFINNATIFNSRQNAKPYLYLLLEDLANNNAYKIEGMWNKHTIKDTSSSSKDNTEYKTIRQERTYKLVQNLARRMLYGQYHRDTIERNVANFMQNMASAKYMVTNLYGGIANITTGGANIAMESAAGEYFSHGDLASAEKDYWNSVLDIVKNLYSEKADKLPNALIKLFNVVEFDQILQYGDGGNNMSEYVKRTRNALYGFQSGGEHIMQNTVLLAMTKSNKMYIDSDGVRRIGDFKDFTQDVEKLAMQKTLAGYENLAIMYDTFRSTMKYDVNKKLDVDTGRKDINRIFLNSLKNSNDEAQQNLYKKIVQEYAKNRKDILDKKKKEFENAKSVESLFEFKDGYATIKKEYNDIKDLQQMLGTFKRKVEAVNKKIHGVYDKTSAAYLEHKWYGSIVMQYHKHLYNGIMKRWRRKGYYSELKGSRERGVYQDLIDFMSIEFEGTSDKIKNRVADGDNMALASIQTVFDATLDTFTNIAFNWNTLSTAEKANCKRMIGELGGILASMLVVAALFGGWDDDDIKDDGFKSSCLYLADRLYSETSMYTPWGLVSEAKTAWSSPIASTGEASDLLKACQLVTQAIADPDFNATYRTGQYAGKNKFRVLLRRNLPGVRPYDRIMDITRNNQYYKIGESQIGINAAKNFGESIRE